MLRSDQWNLAMIQWHCWVAASTLWAAEPINDLAERLLHLCCVAASGLWSAEPASDPAEPLLLGGGVSAVRSGICQ